jgi:hypothetical protein
MFTKTLARASLESSAANDTYIKVTFLFHGAQEEAEKQQLNHCSIDAASRDH